MTETDGLPGTAVRSRKNGINADAVWRRIRAHAGEPFHLLRGKEFTYTLRGDTLEPSTVNQILARSQIEQALDLVPLADTVAVQHLRAPSYLYAILMDARIRRSDW